VAANPGSFSGYSYTSGNPVSLIDPSGTSPCPVDHSHDNDMIGCTLAEAWANAIQLLKDINYTDTHPAAQAKLDQMVQTAVNQQVATFKANPVAFAANVVISPIRNFVDTGRAIIAAKQRGDDITAGQLGLLMFVSLIPDANELSGATAELAVGNAMDEGAGVLEAGASTATEAASSPALEVGTSTEAERTTGLGEVDVAL
jgi:hypothetical protein